MSLLLPEGTRLLHIGPAKTGTTSLQSSFHVNRAALALHGVHYAGAGTQPRSAAAAVAIRQRIAGHRTGLEAWPKLVDEVKRSEAKRVVISSETFARADRSGVREIVRAFGRERLHVVVTMRPLIDILPSSWQQYIQTGSTRSWEAWLDSMLTRDTLHGDQPDFWHKTRLDALVGRWSEFLGPKRITVVSLANAPRDFVLRTFEEFTGLPTDTLVPDPLAENASLGFGASEVIREFNAAFLAGEGKDMDLQAQLVEFGAVRYVRRTRPDVLRHDSEIEVPQWAATRATALMQDINSGLRSSGVNLVGDFPALERASRPPAPDLHVPDAVNVELSANLLVGMMRAARQMEPKRSKRDRRARTIRELDLLTTSELVRQTGARIAQGLRARLLRGVLRRRPR